jgi:hypothetical protein
MSYSNIVITNKTYKSIPNDTMNMKIQYKKKLTNIYKGGVGKKNLFQLTLLNEETAHSPGRRSRKNSVYNFEYSTNENEKKFFEKARLKDLKDKEKSDKKMMKLSKDGSKSANNSAFKPTLNMFMKDTQLIRSVPKEINVLNTSAKLKLNDSLFNSAQNIFQIKQQSRPRFVDELFRKYDYEEIDPWKKIQNRTKNKSLCLSVIKDIYNKLTSWIIPSDGL